MDNFEYQQDLKVNKILSGWFAVLFYLSILGATLFFGVVAIWANLSQI